MSTSIISLLTFTIPRPGTIPPYIPVGRVLTQPYYADPHVPPWSDADAGMIPLSFSASYFVGQELPGLRLNWDDEDHQPIDFSSDWTFELRIGFIGQAAQVVKTEGIYGNNGWIDIAWAADTDLGGLAPSRYDAVLRCIQTSTGSDRKRKGEIIIEQDIL